MTNLLDSFLSLTGDLPYRPKAIFPSELFLFYCCAVNCNAEHIIETGIGYGGSTLYLSKLFSKLTSIDRGAHKMNFEGVHLVSGEASKLLPKIIEASSSNSIAVLIDGPKGKAAIRMAEKALKDKRVKMVAIHDLAFESKKYQIDSHDQSWRQQTSFLDSKCGKALTKHPNGPGLSIFR